ncbi:MULTISPECIES: aldose epimerase [Citrobacter]|jgi:galactose mutarotase-like enzyme|uniref:aldose epimerase family protein n=1 Tax=Citrobacter TaxID=544 RepID=UPI001B832A29|nr:MULTISPECIES: aldose epimerase [Citrobacter]ELK7434223.1 aldose epimerase [Citrobacter braakii]MBR7615831.1 aldose epimerase [Citrobacter braakii]MDL4471695.1 aldose epimerase [Citrobacter braakii]MDL4503424.1 aldose epimerase [Citrobacter braakii]MDM3381405.1 aldose epimerase [Citrobacter sp. Cb003]
MNVWQLENNRFLVVVNAAGGELSSLRDKSTGREWLWQRQPGVWNNSATQLFPVVGALIHEGLRVDNRHLPLPAHGFLRHQTFTCLEQGVNHLLLEACSTSKTLGVWPWCWRIQLRLMLHEFGVSVTQRVFNDDRQPFLYSIGWHPGFALPVSSQTGWQVKFGELAVRGPFPTRNRTLVTEDLTRTTQSFALTEAAFREGAIYFGDCQQQQIRVCSPDGTIVMTLETAEYDWLALWGVPGADLLCIEPLAGTTDAPDFDGTVEKKRGIRLLAPNQSQRFSVKLRFTVDACEGD